MSSKSMKRWLPCQDACEMAGSANFFLSIAGSAVLIHGPRWCSSIASAEMAAIEKKYERQFYCSEVRQADLVFGASEEIIQGLTEIKDEAHPSLTAVLNSCAVSSSAMTWKACAAMHTCWGSFSPWTAAVFGANSRRAMCGR